jgi:hypothetical protein
MKNEIIYGQKPDMESANYIELTLKDENKLDVSIGYKGEPTVWHFIMKNPDKYEAFKTELINAVDECEDGIWKLNDLIQAEDIHDDYELEYDCPAQDTAILVSMDEIDDYISEVSSRLTFYIEGECSGVDMFKHKIDPRKPLGNYSYDYWAGVMSVLNWITMGSEKHDTEPQ